MDHTTIGFRDLARCTLSTALDSLGIDRVPIVAHPVGGHWSQWFAMDRPDRVTALALLGVPGNVLTTQPPPTLRLASVRGLNRLTVLATIPRKTEDALKGLGFGLEISSFRLHLAAEGKAAKTVRTCTEARASVART
jgi:pimeloyl-ACP methyl ester carboxylesterase